MTDKQTKKAIILISAICAAVIIAVTLTVALASTPEWFGIDPGNKTDGNNQKQDSASGTTSSPDGESANQEVEITPNWNYMIACAVYAQYDWIVNIAGEHAYGDIITLYLSDSVADYHSIGGNAHRYAKLFMYYADLVIYTDAKEKQWIEAGLKELEEEGVTDIQTLILPDSAAEKGYSWLSVKNAIKYVPLIAEAMSEMAPEYAGAFATNTEAYIEELKKLDKEFAEMFGNADRPVIFTDGSPFGQLLGDYNVTAKSLAFADGAMTMPSNAAVTEFAEYIKNWNAGNPGKEITQAGMLSTTDPAVTDAVSAKTPLRYVETYDLLTLSKPVQLLSTSAPTYIDIMKLNLEAFREIVSGRVSQG